MILNSQIGRFAYKYDELLENNNPNHYDIDKELEILVGFLLSLYQRKMVEVLYNLRVNEIQFIGELTWEEWFNQRINTAYPVIQSEIDTAREDEITNECNHKQKGIRP